MFRLPTQIHFWHIQIDFRKSGQQIFFANQIQATFGGGLKCNSNGITADAWRREWTSKCFSRHSQHDTQRQRQIQSDGGASERLSRIHAATSRAVCRASSAYVVTNAYIVTTVTHAGRLVMSGYTNPIRSLANNSADSLS